MSQRDRAVRPTAKPVTGRVFLTGGAGFVGRSIIDSLGERPMRVLVRDGCDASAFTGPNIEIAEGDVTKPETLRGLMDDCEAVIHLVAIISEEGDATFDSVIRQGTVNVVREARREGIARLVHMSALGTRNDPRFGYYEAKWQAEQAIQQSGIPWTIFRPSLIFGPDDEFITTLAGLAKAAPVIPIVGAGTSVFQPVSVRDVAAAVVRALADPSTAWQNYELAGGKTYTYEEMVDVIARQLGRAKPKIHVPVALMKLIVSLSRPLPSPLRPPVTHEQLKMLAIDNATDQSATAKLIGQDPLSLEDGIGYIGGSTSRRAPVLA